MNEVAPPLPTEHTHPGLRAEIVELETQVESFRRMLKQFDRDLSDAIDGFYRRRQSDRMREIRSEDEAAKPRIRTWKDLLQSPVLAGKDKTEE
jgi:hypothetical protein